MTTLIALAGNIWVRRAALLIVVLIVLFAVRQHYIDVGKKLGTEDTKQQVATEIAKAVSNATNDSLAKQAAHEQAFKDLIAQQSESMKLALSLAAQRSQVDSRVSGMSATDVEAAIARALNKPAGAPETAQDRQKILGCFDKLDLCEKQVAQDAVTQEKGKAAIAEKESQVSDLKADKKFLQDSFVSLYNLKSTPVRSWKCLKLWRCVTPKIAMAKP